MNAKALRPAAVALLSLWLPAFAATLYVDVNSTNPVSPYTNWATAANVIQDAVDAASDGDTVLVTNGLYVSGGKAIHGTMTNRVAVDKALSLMSVNGPEFTAIKGYQLPVTTNGEGAIRCAYLSNGAALSGFTLTNGATLINGSDLQRLRSGGGVFCESHNALVSDCVIVGNSAEYHGGGDYSGTLNNCTLTGNSADYGGGGAAYSLLNNCRLASNTASYGGGAISATLNNCTLTGNSADYGGGEYGGWLENCTLTDNSASSYGGGDYSGTLNNCTLTGNSADYGGGAAHGLLNNCTLMGNLADYGGGAAYSLLDNCTLMDNSAIRFGGGDYSGTLNNCTLAGNFAGYGGGGAFDGILTSCIVFHNTASYPSDNYDAGSLDYCCTTPLPESGVGNITNAPLFLDTNGWVNLRLQFNSPCINAGNNAYVTTTNDLDGNPRIAGGTVDMGAYEFQDPQSLISYAYLQQYGLPTDGSVDDIDSDGDKATTWQEWKMWTIPTNELSVLKLFHPSPTTNGTEVSWQSVSNHTYTLERASHAGAVYEVLQSGVPSQGDTTTFTDTTATNGGTFLYRVSVPE